MAVSLPSASKEIPPNTAEDTAMLSDTAIKALKPETAAYKVTDEKGLYLFVSQSGGKLWRLNYRFDGKRKTLSLGSYPDVSLKQARIYRDEARTLIAAGTDPSELKKKQKSVIADAKIEEAEAIQLEVMVKAGVPLPGTFEAIARSWLETVHKSKVGASQYERNARRFELHLFPKIGKMPITDINYNTMLDTLKAIEVTGTIETAHRVKWLAGSVFKHAIKQGLTSSNPALLVDELAAPIVKSHKAIIEPKALSGLLRSIWSYSGTVIVRGALKVSVYLPQRPGEIRQMRWQDIDLDAGTWSFTLSKALKGKPKKDLFVDLPHQVIEILREMHTLTSSSSEYVFPSARSGKRPMSDGAVRAAIIRIGFGDEHSAHGFRATLRTMADEVLAQPFAVMEAQLGHAVADSNGTSYNRTSYRTQRKDLLQKWADYIDNLRKS